MSEEGREIPPPPAPSAADLAKTQKQLSLRRECINLFNEFRTLAQKAKQVYDGGQAEIIENPFSEEEVKQFRTWRKKFESAVEKAQILGVVEAKFSAKYQNFKDEDWKKDPFWQEAKKHFSTIEKNPSRIKELEGIIKEIRDSQPSRYKGYKDVGKHPAAIILTSSILPLLILLIYGLDRAISAARLAINKYQKSSAEEELTKAKSKFDEYDSAKSHLYYQAAVSTLNFFQPLKDQEAKKNVEEDENMQKLLKTARDPDKLDGRIDAIKKIHRLYIRGIETGRKSSIDAKQEKEWYDKYMNVHVDNKEADTRTATAYLNLFPRANVEPELNL